MKKIFFFTNLLFTLTAVPIFGQVGTPFSVTSTDTSICEGQSTTLSVQSIPGTITTLACASATNSGTLIAGVAASGVSSVVPYTGGNGGLHNGQTVSSTGVTGLTATLTAGTFSTGNGSLIYTITGTPSATGTASFALNIGGQTCTLSRTVVAGTISALTCTSASNNGTLTAGLAASGVSSIVPYTGGNGGTHNGQIVTSTGVTGLTATLNAGTFSTGNGSLTYTISGTPITNGTANFALNIGGQTCSLSRTVAAGVITTLSCGTATNNGTLIAGVVASGVNSVVPYTGGNGGMHNGQTVTSTGITGLTATLTAGSFANGAGNLTYTITGTPSTNGTASFALNIGGQSCTLTRTVAAGTITALTCASATNNGTLIASVAASGVNSVVPYTGGNGGTHSGQAVASTGITGLTATLSSGSFANGTGSLNYIITGTPNTSGTASFALNIGGQTCTLTRTVATLVSQYPTGSIFCTANPTAIVNVTNPTTGRIWMDRNLGATQVATSSTDANAYGDLYQWGRRSDGHQCRNSATTATLSSTDQPANGNFILAPLSPNDWRNPQNVNLWQGMNGVNNPCPNGYRLPTQTEVIDEKSSWGGYQALDAFNSPLKFTLAGFRNYTSGGALSNVNQWGFYWTSSFNTTGVIGPSYTMQIEFNFGSPVYSSDRAYGCSVRCIKETVATIGSLNCGGMTWVGNLLSGQAATGVSINLPYSAGNGGYYTAQTIPSTGVSGLTATLAAGLIASGSGNLFYTISGTPSSSGTASFAITIGGQSCSFSIPVQSSASNYPSGSVFCASGVTAIVDVTNPVTGKTWMDRNLGASQVATSSTDITAYGDLYQWGRRSDGHQCRTSATTTSLSSTDQPSNGNFILINTPNGDWRSTPNNNLWQGTNGINNPCPTGYRLPTQTEFNSEKSTWSSNSIAGAFGSPIKLPAAGGRASMIGNNGSILSAGIGGLYWTSTTSSNTSVNLSFGTVDAAFSGSNLARADGNSARCIKEVVATVGAINCGSAVQTGVIYSGQSVIGVSISLPYTGGNGGFQLNQVYNSTGVNGLTATLSSGVIANGSGNFVLTISGTAATTGIASFALSIGGQTCNLPVNVETINAIVSSLNCATATTNGTLNSGVAASGVTTTITYTGGNGGNYASQVFSSTGVTGLSATITGGTLANGAGSLVYTISGTPTSSGTASFAITIGGQSCTFSVPVVYNLVALYPAGSVFCPSLPTAIVEVTNPVTGRTWMDRNLGATQVATSSADNASYGDLYQWGRRSDGHQCRTSLTTSNLSTTDQPINSRFILGDGGDGGDWRNPSNNNLWQGVDGINNPCPNGFKVPSEAELNNERLTWLTNKSSGAFSSPLKWTMAGVRNDATGNVTQNATTGNYWTSKVISDQSVFLTISNSSAGFSDNDRAYGRSVRCIKD